MLAPCRPREPVFPVWPSTPDPGSQSQCLNNKGIKICKGPCKVLPRLAGFDMSGECPCGLLDK